MDRAVGAGVQQLHRRSASIDRWTDSIVVGEPILRCGLARRRDIRPFVFPVFAHSGLLVQADA